MKGENSLSHARITYFFKETFRAHSKREYREFLTRGLGENKGGITGTYPWLYVRVFFVMFILFTLNTIILRSTGNTLYVPTVTLLGGITFSIPFMVWLYELYPKRDLSVIKLFGILVIGGTAAGMLTQVGYAIFKLDDGWYAAFVAGTVEELSKAVVAVSAIIVVKNKNSYACFLIAAAVGAGFSVVEDMGYIFSYSDMVAAQYGDIRDTVYLFLERGLSSLCTHILWTGIVGWAYGSKGVFKWTSLLFLVGTITMHACWNLPIKGWEHSLLVAICTVITVTAYIIAAKKSLFNTMSDEYDIERRNAQMIAEAKTMGERMRFTNAANLTFALMCTLLSVFALTLCCLPIGMEKMLVNFESKEDFIAAIHGDYNVKVDWSRAYDERGETVEQRYIDEGNGLRLSYVVQRTALDGYDGTYYYGYYVDEYGNADEEANSIYLELDDIGSRIPCTEYVFGNKSEWAFDVGNIEFTKYNYNSSSGVVSAVINAEEFKGYDFLIALVASAVGVSAACAIILFAFTMKLRRVREDG